MTVSGNTASAVKFEVLIKGTAIEPTDVMNIQVSLDLMQPGMCLLTLKNPQNKFSSKFGPGDSVEIKIGGGTRRADDGSGSGDVESVFVGELVGVEAAMRQGGEPKIAIRAFDKMHRMLRGKKSKTYVKQSDQDIVSAIAGQHGLQADCGSSPKIVHEHVYQHAQDDLSFIRVRAARIGFSVWCEGTKLFFKAPDLGQDSGLEFSYEQQPKSGGGKDKLKSFSARVSNAGVMKKVTVRGWNPEKKEEIVGEAEAKPSKLGSKNAASSLGDFGEPGTFGCDEPIASVEEAKALAQAKLDQAAMGYVTAQAVTMGNNKLKPGIVIKIKTNFDDASDPYNGKYLVAGVTHHYSSDNKGGEGGYECNLNLCRDATGGS
ncbi:MAG: contractile injection system protein, VgrG/Pvc8 family [Kofleriaceae bacterium]